MRSDVVASVKNRKLLLSYEELRTRENRGTSNMEVEKSLCQYCALSNSLYLRPELSEFFLYAFISPVNMVDPVDNGFAFCG